MPGAFEASAEFDDDALRTADEINASGASTLEALERFAQSDEPTAVDLHLLSDIHRRWFETTFPEAAGRHRTTLVLNRKGTAAPVQGIMPGLVSAIGNWNWRREKLAPDDDLELVRFVVSEANTVTVAVYDVHPFVDGNTRTTWHFRNYLLMLDGLRPLVTLGDEEAYEDAWWHATPTDHEALDRVVLDELDRQDR